MDKKPKRVTRRQKKVDKMYADNPKWAAEDRTLAEDMEMKKKGGPKKPTYKTGGMVKTNAKIKAITKATGTVGGTSSAPKTAIPKAKMGMTIMSNKSKPKAMYGTAMKPGMMRKGGSKKSC
jgi:hypothetical protein